MVDIPKWAKWLARDKDGDLYVYETMPRKGEIFPEWLTSTADEKVEETDDRYAHIKWTDEQPTEVKRGLEAVGISSAELNRIMNAKAHGYDEVPEVADKTEPVYIDIDVANITADETHSISFEEAMDIVESKVDDITDKRYETPDIINEPSHYKGRHGLEAIEVVRNFGNDDMIAGFYWGNAIKYMTRYRNKNGLEDLKKARKNLNWLIEHTEAIE